MKISDPGGKKATTKTASEVKTEQKELRVRIYLFF